MVDIPTRGTGRPDFATSQIPTAPEGGGGPNVTPDSGNGALSLPTAHTTRFRLIEATIAFDAIPTTDEDATLTLDSFQGAAYDLVIRRVTPADGEDVGAVVFYGLAGEDYEKGDQLVLAFPNTDGRTWGARIVTELL